MLDVAYVSVAVSAVGMQAVSIWYDSADAVFPCGCNHRVFSQDNNSCIKIQVTISYGYSYTYILHYILWF